jgi:hypothetical protein
MTRAIIASSQLGEAVIAAGGVPVLREGNLLRLPGRALEIAEAIRADIAHHIGHDLSKLKPGSPEAMAIKQRLIERGVCAFQIKLDNIVAAGYDAGIVFNSAIAGCNGLLTMLAEGDIPFVFIAREAGLKSLVIDAPGDADCTTPNPPPGTEIADVTIESVFRGWGYVRLFRTNVPGAVGQTGSIEQIDTYAIPEAQDEQFGMGFGDLTVHEVATDPRPGTNLAYFSYYAGGFRVAKYGNQGIEEVGAFIDEGGNNFWGVALAEKANGDRIVLGSDRDFGLFIFEYTGDIPTP